MALQEKYRQLLVAATAAGVQATEQDGVLYVKGNTSAAQKNALWDLYGSIDPNFLSGDVVMDVEVAGVGEGTPLTVTTESSNLNIRKGPGTDQAIVGKAARGETVMLVGKANDQWWLVRTAQGEEGYAYAQYLSPQ